MIDEKVLIEELKKRIASHEKDAEDFAGETIYSHITETLLRIADETQAVIELVEKQPKVGEWIPCSERLPKCIEELDGDRYPICLVTLDTKEVCLGVYREEVNLWYTKMFEGEEVYTYEREVVAWKRIDTEPYKEEVNQ